MAENEVELRLILQDEISKAMKGVQNNVNRGFSDMKANLVAFNQGLELAKKGIRQFKVAFNFAKMGAEFDQLTVAMDNLASGFGTNSKSIIKDLRQVTNQAVSTQELLLKANQGLALGLKPDEIVEFGKIATATAKAMGKDVGQQFESITVGVARQSRLWLDNLGIIVDVEQANIQYAATLGKTVKKLTDLERRQAFANEAIRKGQDLIKRIGTDGDTAAVNFAQMTAAVGDLATSFASMFSQLLKNGGVLDALASNLIALNRLVIDNREEIVKWARAMLKVQSAINPVVIAVRQLLKVVGPLIKMFKAIVNIIRQVIQFFANLKTIIVAVAKALPAITSALAPIGKMAAAVATEIRFVLSLLNSIADFASTAIDIVINFSVGGAVDFIAKVLGIEGALANIRKNIPSGGRKVAIPAKQKVTFGGGGVTGGGGGKTEDDLSETGDPVLAFLEQRRKALANANFFPIIEESHRQMLELEKLNLARITELRTDNDLAEIEAAITQQKRLAQIFEEGSAQRLVMVETSQEMFKQAMKDSFGSLSAGVMDTWVNLWSGLVQGQGKAQQALVKGAASIVSDIASIWGKFYIADGIAHIAKGIATKDPSEVIGGIKEVAGGAGLLALAGAAKGFASSAGGGGGGAGAGGGLTPPPGLTQDQEPRQPQINIHFEGEGGNIMSILANELNAVARQENLDFGSEQILREGRVVQTPDGSSVFTVGG